MNEWIKIDRSIQDHYIWSDAVKLKCWVALLLNASHSDHKVLIGSEVVQCQRGQIVGSLRSIAEQLGVSKDYIRKFLAVLSNDFMVITESSSKWTRITICNYDSYQGSRHDGETKCRQSEDSQKPEKTRRKGVVDKKTKTLFDEVDANNFNVFYEKYGKKEGKVAAMKAWSTLSDEEKQKVLTTVDDYVAWKCDYQFRKNPASYLNQKCFNDEIPGMRTAKANSTYKIPENAIY